MSAVRRFFLSDEAADEPRPRFAPPSPPARIEGNAVALAAPRDAWVVAGGLAAGLRAGGRAVVACLWCCETADVPAPVVPAFPAARRTVERLQAQGLDAVASGLATVVRLDPEPATALAQLRRTEAVARGPVAVVLTRRHPDLDEVIRSADSALLVSTGDVGLTELVLGQLRTLQPGAVAVARPESPLLRLQLRAGLTRLPAVDPPRVASGASCRTPEHAA